MHARHDIHGWRRRSLGAAWLALVLGFAGAVPAADPQATSLAALSERAWKLAGEGRLDEGLAQVRQAVNDAEEGSPLSSLRRDLATYEEHLRAQHEKLRARHEDKLGHMKAQFEKGHILEALSAAAVAHDTAPDQQGLLADPAVAELVARAESRAAEYEREGRWLRALALYARLSALYETADRERYAQPLKRTVARVGLLRLYAPAVLFEMYRTNAAEDGDEMPEPWSFEQDGWQVQLQGVSFDMLMEAIAYCQEAHVEGMRYEQMLPGGTEMLRVLVSTAGLEQTFPTLGDPALVAAFNEGLDRIDAQIRDRVEAQKNRRERPLRDSEAATIVRRIDHLNMQTLRLPQAVVLREFGEGAMSRLDEFSGVIWPHAKERFERTTTQKFSGVGIQISLVERDRKGGAVAAGEAPVGASTRLQLTVVTPLEGSPAHKAGIHPGDRIVTIDGNSTAGIDLETAVDKITGPEGSQVTLGIQSPGSQEVRQVVLTRASIPIASVKGWSREPGGVWDYYIAPAHKIGYVRMTQFGPDTADELDAAVQSMLNGPGLAGLILDLRNNPGGRLDAAIDVADRFLDRGVIVQTTGRPLVATASAARTYPPFPLIVLVNGRSASASEIVSGALKDHGRALVVGQRSFGKGSVQNLFPIGNKSAYLKLTTQYYKLFKGGIIHRRANQPAWGVDPEVMVRTTDRQDFVAAQARTLLDILREDGEEVDPSYILNLSRGEEEDHLPPIRCADDILTLGLDPQLETALLLLKTRVLGQIPAPGPRAVATPES
jgi:carboxyl-terminal processing protease